MMAPSLQLTQLDQSQCVEHICEQGSTLHTNHSLKPSVKNRSHQASVFIPPTPNPKTSCDIAYMMTQPLAVVPVATANMTHPMNITTASCSSNSLFKHRNSQPGILCIAATIRRPSARCASLL